MSPAELILLSVAGAVFGLDVVSFPQAMISRPIVAATLAGALAGSTASGLLAGATLELIALETLPVGASRYPEWGSASVVGGALLALTQGQPAGALTLAVLGALATAWIGGGTMYQLRRMNGRLARHRLPSLAAGSRNTVIGLHVLGLAADLLRGGLLTLIALLALHPIAQAAVGLWAMDARLSRAIVAGAASTVAAGAAWKLFHGTARARYFFLAGAAVGLSVLASR